MPRTIIKRTEDHVLIMCEVETTRVKALWLQLNDDISRNTLGEPFVPSPKWPGWIRTWAVSIADEVAGGR